VLSVSLSHLVAQGLPYAALANEVGISEQRVIDIVSLTQSHENENILSYHPVCDDINKLANHHFPDTRPK